MASRGIAGKVAVVAMGCSRFGERWDCSTDDLLVEAVAECMASAPRLDRGDIDAYWLGTLSSGMSGLTLSRPLGIGDKPVTRVENMCASGSEAFRNACYAVAAGAYDIVMAVGVEKLKDSGFSGLLRQDPPGDGTASELSMTAPAAFSLLDPAYCAKYAGRLGVFDCSGVSDGAACAIIVPAEHALRYTETPMYVRALSLIAGSGLGATDPDYDYTSFPEVVRSARDAYQQAGIDDPRTAFSLAEVHDCFTPTEIVLMEDLGFADPGQSWKDVLAGDFDADGRLPINPDGGLKSFGHPVGASGLRMLYEAWLQFRGEAGQRQLPDPHTALTHNLGGRPGSCVSFVSVVSRGPGRAASST